MSFFVRNTGRSLVPYSKAAQMALDGLPKGVPLRIDPKQPRNAKFHRLAWAFYTYVADALNDGPAGALWSPESVKDDLLVATGRCTVRPMTRAERGRLGVPDGVQAVIARPGSIKFSRMDEAEFGAFMADAMAYVAGDLCRWIEGSDHWQEIRQILRESGVVGEDA